MKHFMIITIVVATVSLTAWGCNAKDTTDKHAAQSLATHTVTKDTTSDTTTSPTYPLDVCVVSGQKLGSMGKPILLTHQGRTVKLCCQGCATAFKKDPDQYLAKIDAATKKGK